MKRIILRLIAIVLWTVAIFEILGGVFVWRQALADGGTRVSTLTIYRGLLAPPPPGPRNCDILTMGTYSLAMPCNFKPPFVDLLARRRS